MIQFQILILKFNSHVDHGMYCTLLPQQIKNIERKIKSNLQNKIIKLYNMIMTFFVTIQSKVSCCLSMLQKD